MPWKNQGGGPWGSGPKGPWGSGPQPVGPRPPDLEDLLRRAQDRLQQLLPGGYFSGIGVALVLLVALGDALRRLATEIAVIGGAEIYAQWMDSADRLEITEVHARPEGDTYFAAIDAAFWEEVARVRYPAGPDDSADFSYVTYRRRKSH